ncbi:MAG TPA: thioredoxin family protein [Methanoregula sp.]|nr:thioredoxin family protein [Methanoregula sp.]
MDKIIKIFIAVFAIVAVACIGGVLIPGITVETPASSSLGLANENTVFFFYGEECAHCKKIEPFIDNLTKKYPDADIRRLEIWHNQTNAQIYSQLNKLAGYSTSPGVPEVIIGKTVLAGEIDIPAKLEGYIQDIEKKKVNTAQ